MGPVIKLLRIDERRLLRDEQPSVGELCNTRGNHCFRHTQGIDPLKRIIGADNTMLDQIVDNVNIFLALRTV